MRVALCALAIALLPASAAAQLPDHPIGNASGTLSAGAELSATFSKKDDVAFFNYTSYDNDALRLVRARLTGEWRPHAQFSLLGELRGVGRNRIELAAAFLRWRPVSHWNLDVQAGRIPPVIGAFARRAYGRDNPLVGSPLAYQYLTSLRSDALPNSVDDLLRMRARGWRPTYPVGSQELATGLPLVAAFRWDTGASVHWSNTWLDVAGAVTQGSPAYPVVRDDNNSLQTSARIAVSLPSGVTFGASAARGRWIEDSALVDATMSPGKSLNQTVSALDAEIARGRLIVRAEALRVSFDMPEGRAPQFLSPLIAHSGFVETRYRFLSRWQVAVRADRLSFSDVQGTVFSGILTGWDANVTRLEGTVGLRVLRTLELRGGYQYNWRDGGRTRRLGFPTVQLLYWF